MSSYYYQPVRAALRRGLATPAQLAALEAAQAELGAAATPAEDLAASLVGEVVRLSLEGDDVAYRRVLSELAAFLRRTVRQGFARSGLGPEEVEDVVQETFLRLWLHAADYGMDEAAHLAALAGAVDACDEGMTAAAAAVRGSVDLRAALTDTTVPVEKKRDVLRDIFGASVTPEVLADLAVQDKPAFSRIVEQAKASLGL